MLCCAVGSYDPEWRAMWIATVYNIDWPLSSGDSSGEQQQQLLSYLDMAQQLNFNAIVFQGDQPRAVGSCDNVAGLVHQYNC